MMCVDETVGHGKWENRYVYHHTLDYHVHHGTQGHCRKLRQQECNCQLESICC